MVAALFGRSSFLGKVVKQLFIQAPVRTYKIMGNSSSRSYSPSSTQAGCTSNIGQITRTDSSAFVEAVVCNENDLKDNEMKVFDVGEDGKVLLVKQHGEFSAVGTKCTHYGAPLVNGALGEGRIRCPWHGACFNIKTGDIEDFPGFDSLPCYKVTVTDKGQVKVRARLSDLKENKVTKDVTRSLTGTKCECDRVVIVGGGPSGATCAETLRSEGYKGKIVMVCRENYLPYDRIKVSKLSTITDIEKLQARTPEYYKNADIEILKGVEATKIETKDKLVHLNNGSKLKYSSLYVATGSKPRVPDIPGIDLKNIFTVRDYQDSVNILKELGDDKEKNVTVLGLSFIGLEIAATCAEKAKTIKVVGQDSAPLRRIFGEEIGAALKELFQSKSVTFECDATINKCVGEKGLIKSVELSNGKTIPTDMLILGVGSTFYTDFLRDSGINLEPNGAVTVNEFLETNVSNVYAGGDIAFAPVFANNGRKSAIGHIGLAQYHGRTAALNILKKQIPLKTVPYFWTMLFGKSIRYAGNGIPDSTLIDGDVAALKFVLFYFDQAEKLIAIASCQRDPIVSQFAEFLHQGKSIYKKDMLEDRFAWLQRSN